MPDNCIVGRGLENDALGWVEPCQEPATEEYVVPIGIIADPNFPDQDIWLFCANHGKQFRKALNDVST